MGLLGNIGKWVGSNVLPLAGLGFSIANYASGKENQGYMRGMQKEAWRREDSAMQRRVADLKAAGLSPVLAAGGSGAASSAPINAGVPEISGAEVMRGMEIQSAAKQNALTDANRQLVEDQDKKVNAEIRAVDANREAVEASSFIPRAIRDSLERTTTGNDGVEVTCLSDKGESLIQSEITKMIQQNLFQERASKEGIKNADIFNRLHLPYNTEIGDTARTMLMINGGDTSKAGKQAGLYKIIQDALGLGVKVTGK